MEIEKIASGQFGVVKKARHRLDGMVYAIKMTKKPLKDHSRSEKIAMKEIFAAASMMKHKHVVRYYNSWVESGIVFIQNEYCDGGSLEASINNHRVKQKSFSVTQIRKILSDISKGLRYIHSKNLAHLDVKPDNILMTTSVDTCLDTCDVTNVTYKLADFGHIAPVYGQDDEPEEGDCRSEMKTGY